MRWRRPTGARCDAGRRALNGPVGAPGVFQNNCRIEVLKFSAIGLAALASHAERVESARGPSACGEPDAMAACSAMLMLLAPAAGVVGAAADGAAAGAAFLGGWGREPQLQLQGRFFPGVVGDSAQLPQVGAVAVQMRLAGCAPQCSQPHADACRRHHIALPQHIAAAHDLARQLHQRPLCRL